MLTIVNKFIMKVCQRLEANFTGSDDDHKRERGVLKLFPFLSRIQSNNLFTSRFLRLN